MYLDFFGLKKSPFKITPDPSLFFSGGKRGEILEAIVYSITSGAGITKVVGEVGSGKTMLCRMLESKLPKKIHIVYIANPSLSPENILPIIAMELGITLSSKSKLDAMQELHKWLLEQHSQAKQVVVFVEEAQCMPNETLEEIRLLSNLETNEDKLLQIVLFGQPELDENLAKREIRQLKDRISNSFRLGDFSPKEISDYLDHRLKLAGYRGPSIFTSRAVKLIGRYSNGLVRRVNILADKSMLAAFSNGQHIIKAKHVNLAGVDSQFKEKSTISKTAIVLYSVIFTGLFSSVATYSLLNNNKQIERISVVSVASGAVAKPVGYVKPVVEATVKQRVEKKNVAQPIAEVVVKRSSDKKSVVDERDVVDAVAHVVEDIDDEPKKTMLNAEDKKEVLSVESYLKQTDEWLLSENPEFTIQLLYVNDVFERQLDDYLANISKTIDIRKIHVYRANKNGKISYGVLYGSYANRSLAKEAIGNLPAQVKKARPFVRTINSLKRKAIG